MTTNMFKGLADAKVSGKGAYLRPGKYEVRVKQALYISVRKGGNAFILEFSIEKSNYEELLAQSIRAMNGQPYDLVALNKTLPNKAGESASWYQATRDQDIGWTALKEFAAGITGSDPEDPQFKADVEMFISTIVQDGALNGALLPVETYQTKTRKGNDFTPHKWGPWIEGPKAQ